MMAVMAPMTAVARTAAVVAVSTARWWRQEWRLCQQKQLITNRTSQILCFLPTAMAAFVRSDGDDDGGGSGDGGGCRSR